MERKFTLQKSPIDKRDFKLSALMLPQVLNEEKINSMYCGPVLDQLDNGFCWGFAGIAYLNWLYNKFKANSQHDLSPLYLIQQVKTGDYSDYPTQDGESIRAAIKGLQKAGSVAEVRYPYSNYQGNLAFKPLPAELLKISER